MVLSDLNCKILGIMANYLQLIFSNSKSRIFLSTKKMRMILKWLNLIKKVTNANSVQKIIQQCLTRMNWESNMWMKYMFQPMKHNCNVQNAYGFSKTNPLSENIKQTTIKVILFSFQLVKTNMCEYSLEVIQGVSTRYVTL